MAADLAGLGGHKRDDEIACGAKGIHEIGFVAASERLRYDRMDGRSVGFSLKADAHSGEPSAPQVIRTAISGVGVGGFDQGPSFLAVPEAVHAEPPLQANDGALHGWQ